MTNKAYRRGPSDVDGLSVACSHESAKQTIQRGDGVAAIEMIEIPPLGLQLFQDTDDHGYIAGIPYPEENYDLAMELADRLLELSVVTPDHWNRRADPRN